MFNNEFSVNEPKIIGSIPSESIPIEFAMHFPKEKPPSLCIQYANLWDIFVHKMVNSE